MLRKISIAIRPELKRNSRFSAVLGTLGAADHHAALQNSVEQHRDKTGPILQKEEGFELSTFHFLLSRNER